MSPADVVWYLWYANLAATVVLLFRLVSSRLAGVYRWFCWFFVVNLAEGAVRIPLEWRKSFKASAETYMVAHTVGVAVSILLVMQLYQIALAAHPALAQFGRRAVGYMLGGCCAVAGIGLVILPILGPGKGPLLYYFLAFERTADSAVALFLLLAVVFMIWFPVRISQNVAVFIGGFVTYFLTRWASLLMVGLRPQWSRGVNIAEMSLSFLCLCAWIALFRPAGESRPLVSGLRWNEAEMERLSGQLTAINAKLQGFSG